MNIKKLTLTGAGMVVAAALAAQPAPAAPTAVLLHPGGALVQEEADVAPDKDGALRLILPPSADPQSLDMTVPGHAVAVLRFEETAAPEGSAVAELRAQLDEARRALLDVDNALADLEARRDYWRRPPVQFADSAPLAGLDELMRQRLQSFGREEADLNRRAEDLNKRIELLTRQIELTGGDAAFTRQAVVELAEPVNGPVTVRYAYSLDNAGWRPVYRLEARPGEDRVDLNLEAELWQRSGEDWTGVPLALSTADPRQGMIPPRLSEWLIRPRPAAPQPAARSANQMLLSAAPEAAMMADMSSAAGKASAPLYLDGASFESWDLGPRDVPAGPSLRLPLERDTLKAEFSYLLRPSRGEGAYLSAKLDMPELRHYPGGEALFLVDGVSVGKAPFSLSGDDSRIYFGRDPQVTAVMKRNSQQSGKQGIIDRKQTYTWDWDITVFNKHSRPVAVRVEEPAPQSLDEQIAVTVTSAPEAVTEDHTLIWTLDVPAGKSKTIQHKVSLAAPTDMNVWEGR